MQRWRTSALCTAHVEHQLRAYIVLGYRKTGRVGSAGDATPRADVVPLSNELVVARGKVGLLCGASRSWPRAGSTGRALKPPSEASPITPIPWSPASAATMPGVTPA